MVDDHQFFRSGLANWINTVPGLVCCGEADHGAAARRLAGELKPDLLLLDLALKGEDGLGLLKSLRKELPGLRILVMFEGDEDTYAERALRAGSLGYIMKQADSAEVLTAIRSTLTGELYLSRRMAMNLVRRYLQDREAMNRPGGVERLSDRELKVFELMGAGLGNREIAARLGISAKTVDAHRESIKNKLGLASAKALRASATQWVARPS
ncbi:MAG: hypothetical protein RJA22_1581 [Verrucomicrobiota bacterium]